MDARGALEVLYLADRNDVYGDQQPQECAEGPFWSITVLLLMSEFNLILTAARSQNL